MRPITLPVNSLIPALLVLLLGCGSLAVWAQEKAESPPDADADSNSTSSTAPAATTSAEQPVPDNSSENSPFDYQASEEISQDLSVSFPVDI